MMQFYIVVLIYFAFVIRLHITKLVIQFSSVHRHKLITFHTEFVPTKNFYKIPKSPNYTTQFCQLQNAYRNYRNANKPQQKKLIKEFRNFFISNNSRAFAFAAAIISKCETQNEFGNLRILHISPSLSFSLWVNGILHELCQAKNFFIARG